jgi:hypothetical protein
MKSDIGAKVYICAAFEINLGIICGSLPAIKVLLARIWPQLFGTTRLNRNQRFRPTLLKWTSQANSEDTERQQTISELDLNAEKQDASSGQSTNLNSSDSGN